MYYADARGQESFELSDIDPMSDGTLVMGLCTLDGDLSSAQHGAMYRHMLQDAILQCETPTKFTPEDRPRARVVGPKRRGRAHESRSRFVDMDDQWTFQCEIQKRHPLRDETSTDETTPKPDRPRPHLGRNRVLAYGPVCFPHSGVSGASASVRLMIQRAHSARRASSKIRQGFVSVIN